jgi:predicted HD superfamily hydrolase involved in NAD metabolism
MASLGNHKAFMNPDINSYIVFVEQQLTPQRFKHSLGVMQGMSELASIYSLNKTAAMTAGILHDIAKEFGPDDLIKMADENNIALRSEYDKIPLFLHGPIGACYVTQELGLTDSIVLDAISRHSYFGEGVAVSASFCWCLRFADLLEPSRDWEGLKNQIEPFVYSGEITEAAYLLIRWIIPFHEFASLPVHPNIHRLAQELSILRNQKNLDAIEHLPV